MTLQDIVTFLVDIAAGQPLTEPYIARALLLAYELGQADGDLAPTRCLACGVAVRPRIQAKMYCSVQCKARLWHRRMRARRQTQARRITA